jgi:hypothetical protein
MGNLYELNYREHAAEVKKNALNVETVSIKYADGTALHLPYKEWDGHRDSLYHQHGAIKTMWREPGDENFLQAALKTARDKREKAARPAVFKARVQNPKPNIKQQLSAGKKERAEQRAAAPQRAAAKTKSNQMEV